ncbi:MAG: alanine dehydrogenase, partial [Saprospiraceae bacterium]|nr:alanine dehydrogenase [Saprospiraceae bacterium]
MSEKKRIPIPEGITQESLQPQVEMLQLKRRPNKLFIGIPKEASKKEHRVALVPASVALLTGKGHRIVMEMGAGEMANYSDHRLSEAGAEIAYDKEQVFKANLILKLSPPTLEEIDLLRPGQVIISPLHLPIVTAEILHRLKEKRVIAVALEHIKDEEGGFPVVRIMSEIAGSCAMLTAADLMTNSRGGKGVLLGGVSGVPSAKVVILGAGVVAEFATRTALGLGAEVRIFDNNIYKLMRIQNRVGRKLNTSSLIPFQLEKELMSADVAIGAMHSKTGRTPIIVSEDTVSKMKPGSVIVDVSIDQGGCFATSEVTSLEAPTFVKHEVIHYCVPNIASKVARTSSIAISNIFTTMLSKMAGSSNFEATI